MRRLLGRGGILLAALALLAVGCGGHDDDGPGVDGGGGSDGGGSDGGGMLPDSAVAQGQGFVLLRSGASGHLLRLHFTHRGAAGFCSYQTDGPCQIETCLQGTESPRPGAGDVTITGTSPGLAAPALSSGYADVSGTQDLWTGGEAVRIRAPGAMVPAFDVTLTAPGSATPVTPAAGAVTVTRGQPMTLTWSGGAAAGAGTTYVAVLQTPTVVLKCSFAAAAGTGTVPGSAIMQLPAGGSGMWLTLTEAYQRLDLAGWDVRFALRRFASTLSLQVN